MATLASIRDKLLALIDERVDAKGAVEWREGSDMARVEPIEDLLMSIEKIDELTVGDVGGTSVFQPPYDAS